MRQFMIKALAILISVLATFVLMEAILRFLPYNSGMVAAPVNDAQPIYRFLADRDVRYSQDWDMKNSRIRHVNKDGFLSDIEYRSQNDSPLIALIGDSDVEAIQVDWEETAHGRLHRNLAPDIRVYAFGAAYAALAQYLSWAEYAKETYGPDMLVVNLVANDFLQKLPKPGSRYTGGFQGMHYFSQNDQGDLVVMRSDRPAESWRRRLARKSALVAYAYRNAGVTSMPAKIRANLNNIFNPPKEPVFIANTVAKVSQDDLTLSKRQVDAFLNRLAPMSGLEPSSIVIVIDGLRPELYDLSQIERTANTFPAIMAKYIRESASRLGYEVIDLQPLFMEEHQENGRRFEFSYNNHWNAHGHDVMSEAVMSSQTFDRIFKP
ncbi:MAG: hypothetical protein NXI27_08655 [Alphaproteobacteria bacterium]|nr:hypothetical protein [Alphaproteobacteria bacterium]